MSVDAYHAKTGLKMVTNMHSSSAVDGQIKIEDSQIITTKLNWPKEKIEIFNVKSKFFLLHCERNPIDKKLCTGKGLKKSLGLQLCGEVKLVTGQENAPYFPFTGPSFCLHYFNKDRFSHWL